MSKEIGNNQDTKFSGNLDFHAKECPFSYEDGILTIDTNDKESVKKYNFQNHDRFEYDVLVGKITGSNKLVRFFLDCENYGIYFEAGLLTNFSIKIAVKSYMIIKEDFIVNSFVLTIENDKFRKWLGIYEKFKLDSYKSDSDKITFEKFIDVSSTKSRSTVLYKGSEITFGASYRVSASVNTECFPQLEFSFKNRFRPFEQEHEKPLTNDIRDLTEFMYIVFKFLQISHQVKSVDIGRVSISVNRLVSKGVSSNVEIAELHIPWQNNNSMYVPEINKLFDNPFICWSSIIKHFDVMFKLISNNKIPIEHLPKSRSEINIHSKQTIMLDFMAFESSFKNIKPEYKTKREKQENFVRLKHDLKEMIGNYKEDAEVSTFLNNVMSLVSNAPLREKLDVSFDEFNELLLPLQTKIIKQKSKKKIIDDILLARNPTTHGAGKILNNDIVESLAYFRYLILCMELKSFGFEDSEIIQSVKNIYSKI